MAFDIVIRNGTVVDGSGLPSYRADVGIVGDRIGRIGRISEKGNQEIDAEGHTVSPGFIDGHTHMDAQVMWDPLGTCSCWHGITTVVMGNCGFTLAPAPAHQRALVVRNLERAEDISGEAMASGIDWTWETYPEYLDAVDRRPKAINYAGQVGHSALRTWAMGERAFTDAATEEDMVLMERQLKSALEAGAFGFSTSRSADHETSDDRPVASRQATWDEVARLVNSMGGGTFELALEPNVSAATSSPEVRAEALGRMRDLAISSGAVMSFGVGGAPGLEALAMADETALAGGRMYGQSHSRGIYIALSFLTQLPFDKLPEWSTVRALPLEEQRKIFSNPDARKRLVDSANHSDYGRAIGLEARAPDYTSIHVVERGLPPNPSLSELAASRGQDPVDVMIDVALATNFEQIFIQRLSYGANPDEVLLKILKHPRTVMTFSDSGAHVSQIMDASIQTHLLGYWVRERQEFTLEEAIRMITLMPAQVYGFSDRGMVREGMIADLNVFDADRIAPGLPKMVFDLPGGSARIDQRSEGILATLVGGAVTIENKEHTGALPGRLVRGPFAKH